MPGTRGWRLGPPKLCRKESMIQTILTPPRLPNVSTNWSTYVHPANMRRGPTLVYCWADVVDGGPTVNQRWVVVSWLLDTPVNQRLIVSIFTRIFILTQLTLIWLNYEFRGFLISKLLWSKYKFKIMEVISRTQCHACTISPKRYYTTRSLFCSSIFREPQSQYLQGYYRGTLIDLFVTNVAKIISPVRLAKQENLTLPCMLKTQHVHYQRSVQISRKS